MEKNGKQSSPASDKPVGESAQPEKKAAPPVSAASIPDSIRPGPQSAAPGVEVLEHWHPGASCPSVYGDGEGDTFRRSRMPRSPHWSVPWSDLMMTMFIFFAVLFIYQSAHRDFELRGGEAVGSEMGSSMGTGSMGTGILGEGGSGIGQQAGTVGSIAKVYDLGKQLMEEDFAEVGAVDLVPDKAVKIILTSDLLFDLGKADLKPRARELLSKVAGLLRQTTYPISVNGHTDTTPIHSDRFPTNWELSAIRASVVARYLIEEMRLPGKRFTITGHAYFQPLRPNDTAKNKAVNRRVEIVISRGEIPLLPVMEYSNKEERFP